MIKLKEFMTPIKYLLIDGNLIKKIITKKRMCIRINQKI